MGLLDGTTEYDYYSQGTGLGSYQFTSLEDVITYFRFAYIGEDKIISKARRSEVAFHAQRGLQELSFDTFKSCKAMEITVPASLQMVIPRDYVNYTKISWVDSAGIKHLMYPTTKTSNPYRPYQNTDIASNDVKSGYLINPIGTMIEGSNIVVLNDDYRGILMHGMKVSGPNLKPASYIHNMTTTDGLTSVTLMNKDGDNDKNALATTNEQLLITRFNFPSLGVRVSGQSLIETTATVATIIGDTQINVASVEGIKIGMYINQQAFINNNNVEEGKDAIKVIGIGTSTVELSHACEKVAGIGETVGFVSNSTDSTAWSNYKSQTPSENNNDDYEDDTYWPANGERYGLDPQHAQANGSFYIDDCNGKINFSSNIAGKTVILDYISDTVGLDKEMQVHKFAEEALYKWIAYAIISNRINTPEYIVQRYKKERFAAVRTAKLRLSNIKLEELTQILRGKSKQIKH